MAKFTKKCGKCSTMHVQHQHTPVKSKNCFLSRNMLLRKRTIEKTRKCEQAIACSCEKTPLKINWITRREFCNKMAAVKKSATRCKMLVHIKSTVNQNNGACLHAMKQQRQEKCVNHSSHCVGLQCKTQSRGEEINMRLQIPTKFHNI